MRWIFKVSLIIEIIIIAGLTAFRLFNPVPPISGKPSATSESASPSASAAAPSFTFAVAGDTQNGDKIYGQIIEKVNESGAAFFLHTGDMVTWGGAAEWQHFKKMQEKLTVPFYAVPGNHDVVAGKTSYRQAVGDLIYSFDYQSAHFIILDNSFSTFDDEQLVWLEKELAENKKKLIFLFMHYPPVATVTNHTMSETSLGRENVEKFFKVIAGYKIGAIFAGHVHGYAAETVRGVPLYISGGAGAPLYLPDFLGGFYNFLKVKVIGGRFSVEVEKIE